MDLLDKFVKYLASQKQKPSKTTIKNYKADVRQFIDWFNNQFHKKFKPGTITYELLESYKKSLTHLSTSSVERHLSSLRKFFTFLKLEGIISKSPFELRTPNSELRTPNDPWQLRSFKDYLYVYNSSHLTIKNYIMDVRQFLTWAEKVTGVKDAWDAREKNIFKKIDSFLIQEYKERLLTEAKLSPVSINRKLSSLRKYLSWLEEEGIIRNFEVGNGKSLTPEVGNLDVLTSRNQKFKISNIQDQEPLTSHVKDSEYSPFPPFRLVQKI